MPNDIDQSVEIQSDSSTVRQRIDQLNAQAELIERATPSETLRLAHCALQMADTLQYRKGIAKSLYLIGRGHLRLGDLFDSETYLKNAYVEVMSLSEPNLEAEILNALGIVHLYLKSYDLSFKYYQRALSLSKKINDQAIEAKVLNNIGEIYRELKDFEKALSYYEMSRKLHLEVSSPINKSMAVSNLAGLYLETGDDENAAFYIEKATELARAENNLMIESACYQYAGILARRQGNFDASLAYLTQSLELNKQTKESFHEAEVLIEIHKSLFAKGERSRSLKALFSALNIAHKLRSDTLAVQVYNEMIPTCEALDRIEDTLAFYKKRHEALEAIEKREQAQRLRGLEIQLEADLSFQEKEAYRKLSLELEQKAKELEAQSIQLREAYHTLKVISEIGQEITAVLSLESIYTLVHQHIQELMPADMFGIGLYNPKLDAIHYDYLIEDGKRLYNVAIPLSRDNSFAVWCFKNRKEIMVNSDQMMPLGTVSHFTSTVGALMPAIMFYPLIVEDEMIGIITVQSRIREVYTKQTLNTLGTLTSYLSVAIQNAQKSERLHREILQREAAQQELHKLNQELAALSEKDGLTGIANRRRFDEFYQQEWSRSARAQEPLTLMMIDIDYFKQFNDTYGHISGDEMIIRIAGLIGASVKRTSDLVARYGGDEFIVLLSNTCEAGALTVAQSIQSTLRDLEIEHASAPLGKVTLSIGLSTCVPSKDLAQSELIQSVDAALYEAKQSGRNQIVSCGSGDSGFTTHVS